MKNKHLIPYVLLGCVSTVVANAADNNIDQDEVSDLPVIVIESDKVREVSVNEVKSADLAEVLTKKKAAVSLVRRSGIANDIILRGQKKDNINILIDNAKVYGACPNRMDPPTSHILTNNIEDVEIISGPLSVHVADF